MISIIICSKGVVYREKIIQNIELTIDVPHEIVIVDNSENQFGICDAYNVGAKDCKYDILCFTHEDVEFQTFGWGNRIIDILRDKSIGVLGVAGGKWLIQAPSSWWGCGKKYLSINLRDQGKNLEYNHVTYSNPENKNLVDVAVVDGLWLCVKKEVWKQYPFDSQTFSDFHFYDISFCANIFPHYRICVTYDVNIVHYSLGNFNDSWFINADKFYRKYQSRLPIGNPTTSIQADIDMKFNANMQFILEIIKRKLPSSMGIIYVKNCVKFKPLNRDTWWLVRRYLQYAILHK